MLEAFGPISLAEIREISLKNGGPFLEIALGHLAICFFLYNMIKAMDLFIFKIQTDLKPFNGRIRSAFHPNGAGITTRNAMLLMKSRLPS